MLESITTFCDLAARLRATAASPQLLNEAVSAARMAWATALNMVAASGGLDPGEAMRFNCALDEAIATVGQSGGNAEFVVRLRWYQVLLDALAAGGEAAVSPLIEATRDGLILGRSLAEILPGLRRDVSAPVIVHAP